MLWWFREECFLRVFCSDSADAFVSIYTSTVDNAGELLKKAFPFLIGAMLP